MKFKIGDSAAISKTITDGDIQAFAEVTGDHNPMHLDDEYAAKTRFGSRIAHGMLSASLISSVLANKLPGPGSVYLSQTLKFVKPVLPGDSVTARVTVTGIRDDKPIITLETVCVNQHNEPVLNEDLSARVPAYAWYALGLLTLVYVLNFLDRSLIYISFRADQERDGLQRFAAFAARGHLIRHLLH